MLPAGPEDGPAAAPQIKVCVRVSVSVSVCARERMRAYCKDVRVCASVCECVRASVGGCGVEHRRQLAQTRAHTCAHICTLAQEFKRAGDIHSRVDAWAPEEEKRIGKLQARLQALLASSDSMGAPDEKLAQLKEELSSLTSQLGVSAEELRELNDTLDHTLQDTKVVQRRYVCERDSAGK